jgi:ribonucleotide reductase alpha subunit
MFGLCAVYKFIADNDEKIGSSIVYDRDMNYDFFAFKTLERAYLLKLDNKIAERPQHMIMRGECQPAYPSLRVIALRNV